MTFTINRLAGGRAIVDGTDVLNYTDRMVIDTTEWDRFNHDLQVQDAAESFDEAVREFYAPIIDAAEALSAQVPFEKDSDPLFYEVVAPAIDHVEGRSEVRIHLSKDSVILKLIERGDTDRLVWVNGSLEILEAAPDIQPVVAFTEDEPTVSEPTA